MLEKPDIFILLLQGNCADVVIMSPCQKMDWRDLDREPLHVAYAQLGTTGFWIGSFCGLCVSATALWSYTRRSVWAPLEVRVSTG